MGSALTAFAHLLDAATRSRRALLALDALLFAFGVLMGSALANALLIHADLFAMPIGVMWGVGFAILLLTDPFGAPAAAWFACGAMAVMAGKYALPPGPLARALSTVTVALPVAGAVVFAIIAAGS